MDTLYIGDIPNEFHYAKYNQYYIDLYNTDTLHTNNTYTYYRVYLYDNFFTYQEMQRTIGSYNNDYASNISVSNDFWFRNDLDSISCVCLFGCLLFLFIVNLISSIIRKNGVLSGLI